LDIRGDLVYLTSEEMKEADGEAISEFEIDVLSLMENAGSAVASLTRTILGGSVARKRIGVLVGKGNNGGDGLVAARHLHAWGAEVRTILCDRHALGEVPAKQLKSVEKDGIPVLSPGWPLGEFDILVDSLLGYNSRGNPREPVKGMILGANASGVPILAVDIPSGLDASTGDPNDPCIVASSTLALGFPKTGFLNTGCRRFVGSLYLGDVAFPQQVYLKRFQKQTPFDKETVVRIW